MTVFSQAQYEAVVGELEAGTITLQARLAEVRPAAQRATSRWWMDAASINAVNWAADQIVQIGTAILEWIIDVLKGATAPIWMFRDSHRWMDLRRKANAISTDLSAQNLVIDNSDWSGKARDNYLTAAGAQAGAATRVGSIADATSGALLISACAGLLFYIAVVGVLLKVIPAIEIAVVSLGLGAFSWTGIALILGEAGFAVSMLATAATTLALFLGAQVDTMIKLQGETMDPAGFPKGAWPRSNSTQYDDASVKDGNARWSLKDG